MVILTSFSPPTEGIKHEQPSTKLVIGGRVVGTGTLYIAESKLAWMNNSTGEGFSVFYPHIGVHAVTKDLDQIENKSLLIMVDTDPDGIEEIGDSNEENEDDNTEIHFVPEDKGQLDAMYVAMTYCQSLHPDQDQLSEDEYLDADEDGEDYSNGGGDSNLMNGFSHQEDSNGHADEEMETDGQFQDAED